MSGAAAKRFAETLLNENSREGQFEVQLDDANDLDLVAGELAALGCVVAKNGYRNVLTVTCPEGYIAHTGS